MSGIFPELWLKSIIIPIFKKGDVNDTGNYRGISLLSHVGKLFTSLINLQLVKWSEENDILTDAQFGFRPGLGTTDATFALHSLISNTSRKGKRLYCCFIDYIKAFDSVAHVKLWLKLSRIGITGKLLNAIKSMYSKLKACVRLDSNYSDIFTYNVGLMQGESLSPLLYSLHVNDIEVELINQGCQSYELKKLNLFLLMYADDTVIFSENVEDLQNLINSVNVIANDHGLYVNLNKTKIVVFRSRGNVKPEERWSLNRVILLKYVMIFLFRIIIPL